MKDANGTRNNLGGQSANGQSVNGQSVNGQAANGQSANGQSANGQASTWSGANGKSANGYSANGQSANRLSIGGAISRISPDRPAAVKLEPTRRSRRNRRRLPTSAAGQDLSKAVLSDRTSEARSARSAARANRPMLVSRVDSALGQAGRLGTSAKRAPLAASEFATGSTPLDKSLTGKRPARALPARSTARRRNTRRSFKTPVPLLYLSWLVISGLGLAVIGGTLLTVLPNSSARSAARTESALATTNSPAASPAFPIELNQEVAALKAQLQGLPNLYPGLTPKAFYIDVDTGSYVDLDGGEAIAAASTIKLPILLAFFEEIDAGRINPSQTMAIQPEQIAEGSGDMQLSPPGTQFTALEVATRMIVGSDNTATNMMIDLLGGAAALNQRFKAYGLEKTQLLNPLPDLEGTNMTSARDLARTMLMISQGDTLTLRSRDRIFNILQRTRNKSLLAAGLEEKEALTYNKTGDIESVLADVALVDLPNGKRYIVAALVTRPANDGRAAELIHRISQYTYQESEKAIQPAVSPLGNPASPSSSSAPTGAGNSPSSAPAVVQPDAKATEAKPPAEEPYPSANPRANSTASPSASPSSNENPGADL